MPRSRMHVAAGAALVLSVPSLAAAIPITGMSNGVFLNPLPVTAVTTGVGTSSFTFGTASPGLTTGSLDFVGLPFGTDTETDFQIGTLTYHNGTLAVGTEATSVDLQVGLTFTTPPVGTEAFTFGLSIINTINDPSDPDASADFLILPVGFSSSVFMFGGTAYTLEILGFRNVVGDGFLTSSDTQFHVREELSASAELWGRVTADIPGAIPEPGTLLLLGSGLLASFWRRRRA